MVFFIGKKKKDKNIQVRFCYSNVLFWFVLVSLLSLKVHKIHFATVHFHIFRATVLR